MIRCCFSCQNYFDIEEMELFFGLYHCRDCYERRFINEEN